MSVTAEPAAVRPFRIEVPEEQLAELRRRLSCRDQAQRHLSGQRGPLDSDKPRFCQPRGVARKRMDVALAGVKRGRDQVLEYSAELLTRSADVLRLDVHDVLAGEDHGVSLLQQHAERDGEVFDHHVVLVVHTRDGQFSEVWEFHEDDSEYDRFWG